MTAITNKEWDKHFSPEGRVRFWSRAYRPRRLIADMTWDQAIKECPLPMRESNGCWQQSARKENRHERP